MLWAGMILHAEKRQQIPESGSRGYGGHNGQKEIQLSRGQDGENELNGHPRLLRPRSLPECPSLFRRA